MGFAPTIVVNGTLRQLLVNIELCECNVTISTPIWPRTTAMFLCQKVGLGILQIVKNDAM